MINMDIQGEMYIRILHEQILPPVNNFMLQYDVSLWLRINFDLIFVSQALCYTCHMTKYVELFHQDLQTFRSTPFGKWKLPQKYKLG